MEQVGTAIAAASRRVATVLRSSPDTSTPVPGLEWTLGEAAVHLAAETYDYARLLTGEIDSDEALRLTGATAGPAERSAILNRRQLTQDADRSPARLADAVESAAALFAGNLSARPAQDRIQVTNGVWMTVDGMARVILGEQLIHGLDIARAAGTRWHISREDALLVLEGVMPILSDYLDPTAAGDLEVGYELRFRKGSRYYLEIAKGSARVSRSPSTVDCRINADPVAFLLVGYQRSAQWRQILLGRIVAYGRRPWLGFKFGRLLTSV